MKHFNHSVEILAHHRYAHEHVVFCISHADD
jgi:hypothetical protein